MAASADGAARAHFQLYAASPMEPVRWRLLAANNRELGRSVTLYDSEASARSGIEALIGMLDALVPQVRRSANGWVWALSAADQPIVESPSALDRRNRAATAHTRFLEAAAVAWVSPSVMLSSSRRWNGGPAMGSAVVDMRDQVLAHRTGVAR
jgi:uncharacterized protein YegP (UPF0339 family)